jgi:hypothetical protein
MVVACNAFKDKTNFGLSNWKKKQNLRRGIDGEITGRF